MEGDSETRERDGRQWQLGRAQDVAWINAGTEAGVAVNSAIPPIYDAYWTLECPGSGEHDLRFGDALRYDLEVVQLLHNGTEHQPWWLGFLQRGPHSNLIFPDAPRLNVINGDVVLIYAAAQQALDWRSEDEWPHGSLPDVMFPRDRSWLAITLWDDDWMCFGGPAELQRAFVNHPYLSRYARKVAVDDPDATPPGHIAI